MTSSQTKVQKEKTRKARKCFESKIDLYNPRKRKMIVDTFDYLEKGHNTFYHFMLSLMGGCDMKCAEIVVQDEDFLEDDKETEASEESTRRKTTKNSNKEAMTPDLFMANCCFRIVPLNEVNEDNLSTLVLIERFEQYAGKSANSQVSTYLHSNYDKELYGWKDMRMQFNKVAADMNVTEDDLRTDLAALFQDKLLGDKVAKGWNLVSNIFGTGIKAKRSPKLELYRAVTDRLEKIQDQDISEDALANIYLECGKCNDGKELKAKFFNTGTSPKIIDEIDSADPTKLVNVKNKIQFLKLRFQRYGREYGFKCKSQLLEYFVNRIGSYDANSWSEMLNNALASIKSKTTRNCNFVLEQMQLRKQLVSENVRFFDLINQYFESSFNAFECTFTIKKSHICATEIQGLYVDWENVAPADNVDSEKKVPIAKEKDSEEQLLTLDQLICKYVENCSFESKSPIPSLLHYLHSVRDQMSAKQLLLGLEYGKLKHKIDNHKLHPMVPNNPTFNFGLNGKLWAKIFSPEEAVAHQEKLGFGNKLNPAVWMSMEVLVQGKWERHHFYFCNKRFQQEIYAKANVENNSSDVVYVNSRDSRSGHQINPNLSQEQIQLIGKNKSHSKVVKLLARLQAAKEQNLLTPVAWNPNWNIGIQKIGNSFHVFISQLHEVKRPKDIRAFLSYDLNQYSSNTYTLSKLSDQSDVDAYLFNGKHVNIVENGFITACVSVGKGENQRQFDQLSYAGVSWDNMQEWVNARKEFVTLWRNVKQKNNQGQLVDVDLVNLFDRMNLYKPNLYAFNKRCCQLIKKTLKDKSPENLRIIRQEIFELIKNGSMSILKLSSLSQNSFDMFRNAKSLISSYFNNLLGPRTSDEQKIAADKEMFDLRLECETKRSNKQKSKVDQIAGSIVRKAISFQNEHKEIACIGEELGKMTSSGNKTQTNASLQDWASTRIAKRVSELSTYHDGLDFRRLLPKNTSHMNPFVWANNDHQNADDKPLKPRWDMFDLDLVNEEALQKLKFFLRGDKKNKLSTSQYYREGMLEALDHYGLTSKEFLRFSLDEFKSVMRVKIKELNEDMPLFPKRGGKLYQATYKVDKDAKSICFNGRQYWLTNADIIASVNLALLHVKTFVK